MSQAKKLRPRYQRVDKHPDKRLTPRDGRVLNWVYEMRFLSREQIQRLEFDSSSGRYCRDRLRRLFDAGYLDRRRLDLGTGFGANMPVYGLDKKGAEWIALDQKMDSSEVDWKPRDNEVNPYFMEHALAINDFWIDVVLATRESEYELERWIPERTLKSEEMKDYVDDPKADGRIAVVPDGYFCIGLADGRRACFALELDRGTVKKKSWRRKIRGYLEYARSGRYRERYGTTSLRIVTVVQAARRAQGDEDEERLIRTRVEKIKGWTEEEGGDKLFWFAAEPDVAPETILAGQIWQVGGADGHYGLIE